MQGWQEGQGAFYAKVAARHHYHVCFVQNLGQVINSALAFKLYDHGHAFARSGDELLGFAHVVSRLHIRNGHGIHAQLEAVGKVFFVLFGQGAHLGSLAGQGQTLARCDNARIVGFKHHQTVSPAFCYHKLKAAVGQHHAVTGFEAFKNNLVVKGQVRKIVGVAVAGAKQQLHALGNGNAGFGQHAKTNLGARKILHNGNGPANLGFNLTYTFDYSDKIRSAAVRKVEAEYTDSGFSQFKQFFFAVGGGTDSGDNFCSHIRSFG